MRYVMMIQLDRCIGCQACVSSCKERWDTGPEASRDWVRTYEHGQRPDDLGITFYPGLCNHCEWPACIADCPTGATYQNEQSVVVVDSQVCIGCGNCVPQCPYGARRVDERKGIVEKCNFCAPYVARGEQPACVATCLAECRHFGDLDDSEDEVVRLIREHQAEPLKSEEINIGPRVYYAPPEARQKLLAQGVVVSCEATKFSSLWRDVTRPLARYAVSPLIAMAAVGGMMINLRARMTDRRTESADAAAPEPGLPEEPGCGQKVLRHRTGMRFLHWFNLLSWILLLGSGTALLTAPAFAIFGTSYPAWLSGMVGGQANLLYFHVAWGGLWSLIIVPLFIYYKNGGGEAIREITPTRDDLRWLQLKPLVMLGLTDRKLPPQDKYNCGQKLFAIAALLGTAVIIGTGVVMAFHLGSADLVRAAVFVH